MAIITERYEYGKGEQGKKQARRLFQKTNERKRMDGIRRHCAPVGFVAVVQVDSKG